ncbi:MAG: DNA mismatch endonuclease Vsr [Oscillospiraceae bacterium]|nr:DNA mismatch endonuclease Vsr [Oscillospiraceae bacterium]
MADNHTKEVRSKNMSHIRCKDTKPEIKVRSFLHKNGFRFRKNDKRYPGKPDIILPKYKTAVYVNGCFWHMHDCGRFVLPKSNTEYWTNKLNKNKIRDAQHYEDMKKDGWKVILVWECDTSEERLNKLILEIKGE